MTEMDVYGICNSMQAFETELFSQLGEIADVLLQTKRCLSGFAYHNRCKHQTSAAH